MGTVVTFHVEASHLAEANVREAISEASKMMHRHDELFSAWQQESPMSRVRRDEISA